MHSLNKLSLAGILIFFLLFIGIGCTDTNEQTNTETNKPDIESITVEQDQQPPDISLPVYFVEFTEQDAYLIREVHTIPHTNQVAHAAMEELINDDKSILPDGVEVLGITVENGLATIDFSQEVLNNASVGSEGEELGIQSIVNTLTDLPNIEKVAFHVEGKADDRTLDWWGHVGLYEQPFAQDYSRVYQPTIWVTHPSADQVVGVPLFIKGSAMVNNGQVYAKILDKDSNVLTESSTTTKGTSARGDFEMSIKFDPPVGNEGMDEGVLKVYGYTGEDDFMEVVTIPVYWP